MSADALLSRLDRVKRMGDGRWVARCPSHEDRSPSLSVRELDDGRVLAHCFAGCAIDDVLSACGLQLADLFPDGRVSDHGKPERRPFPAGDVLRCVALESLLVAIVAAGLARGHSLTDNDRERLMLAAQRLGSAAEVARV